MRQGGGLCTGKLTATRGEAAHWLIQSNKGALRKVAWLLSVVSRGCCGFKGCSVEESRREGTDARTTCRRRGVSCRACRAAAVGAEIITGRPKIKPGAATGSCVFNVLLRPAAWLGGQASSDRRQLLGTRLGPGGLAQAVHQMPSQRLFLGCTSGSAASPR